MSRLRTDTTYSEVVSLTPGGGLGPVVDGLGGFTYAAVITQGFGDGPIVDQCNAPGVAIATRIGP